VGVVDGFGSAAGLVWYAAYGSNLCAARFAAYLGGGRPAGANRTYPGSRDRRPPLAVRPCLLRRGIHFALRSAVWDGGLPFLDHDADDRSPGAPARAYLLRRGQFDDLVAQENHRPPGSVRVDLDAVTLAGRVELGPGCYDTLVHLDTWDDVPLVSFTAPFTAAEVAAGTARATYRGEPATATANGPSDAYLRVLADGYREAHGFDTATVAASLARRPGVGRSEADLRAALERRGAPDDGMPEGTVR
jgi:hypothetical protein